MSDKPRKGGIIAVFAVGVAIAVSALMIGASVIAGNVHLQHRGTADGARVHIDTPLGAINIDARDTLKPEAVGIPVYPGAFRERVDHGGLTFDFESSDGPRKQFSVVTAQYYTRDTAQQVREFYRNQFPHWIFTERRDGDISIEYSEGGYKRIIAIHERGGRTQFGIAALGEPGVN